MGPLVMLRVAFVAVALAIIASGCIIDYFDGFEVWVVNDGPADRYVVFVGQDVVTGGGQTLRAPADGVEYRGPNRELSPKPDLAGEVRVYDPACRLIETFKILASGEYKLDIDATGAPHLATYPAALSDTTAMSDAPRTCR
jgi:hypothetical protein